MSFGGGGTADYRINYIISTKSEGTGAGPINQVSAATDKMTAANKGAAASADQLKTAHERVIQSGLGVSKAAKGMAFGIIGMTTAGAEMVGMMSMWQATQDGVREAQEAVTAALKEGGEGSADYKNAMMDLAKANRWAQMTFRNLLLSIFDMIPFIVLTVNGLLKLRTALAAANEAKKMEAALRAMGVASKGATTATTTFSAAQAAANVQTVASTGAFKNQTVMLGTATTATNAATVATGKLSKAMRVLSLAMKIAIPLVLLEIGSQAFVNNWGGFADKLNQVGAAAGNAVPQLKGVFEIIGKIGRSIAAVFTGNFGDIGEIWSGEGAKKIKTMTKAEEKALKDYENMLEDAINQRQDFFAELSEMDNKEQDKLRKAMGFKGEGGKDLEKVLDRFEKVKQKITEIGNAFMTIKQLDILDNMGLKGADIELEKTFFTLEDKFDKISELFSKGSWGKEIFNKAEEVMRKAAKNPEDAAKIIAEFIHNDPEIIKALEVMGMHDVANFLFVTAEEEMKRQQAEYVAKHKAQFDKMKSDEESGKSGRDWFNSGLGEASDIEEVKTEAQKTGEQIVQGLIAGFNNVDWSGVKMVIRDNIMTPMVEGINLVGEALPTLLRNAINDNINKKITTENSSGGVTGVDWEGLWNQILMGAEQGKFNLPGHDKEKWDQIVKPHVEKFWAMLTSLENWDRYFKEKLSTITNHPIFKFISNPLGYVLEMIKGGQKLKPEEGGSRFTSDMNKHEQIKTLTIEQFMKDTGIQGWLDSLPTFDELKNKVMAVPGVQTTIDALAAIKKGGQAFLDWILSAGGNIAFGDTGNKNPKSFELNDADFDKEFAKITIPPIDVPEVDVVPGHLNITPQSDSGGPGREGSGIPGTWGSAYATYIGATPTVMIPEVNATTQNVVFLDLAIQAKTAFDAIAMSFDQNVVAKIADGSAALASHWSSIMNSFINNAESATDGITSAIEDAMSQAEERMSDLASHWSSMCNSLINNAEAAADGINDALDSIEDEEVIIRYRTVGSPPSGHAHGTDQWVHKPTLFMAGEAGSERVQVSRSGSGRDGGGSGGASTIHLHQHLLEREIVQILNIDKGRMVSKYGPT